MPAIITSVWWQRRSRRSGMLSCRTVSDTATMVMYTTSGRMCLSTVTQVQYYYFSAGIFHFPWCDFLHTVHSSTHWTVKMCRCTIWTATMPLCSTHSERLPHPFVGTLEEGVSFVCMSWSVICECKMPQECCVCICFWAWDVFEMFSSWDQVFRCLQIMCIAQIVGSDFYFWLLIKQDSHFHLFFAVYETPSAAQTSAKFVGLIG